jgi:hypothetical protein
LFRAHRLSGRMGPRFFFSFWSIHEVTRWAECFLGWRQRGERNATRTATQHLDDLKVDHPQVDDPAGLSSTFRWKNFKYYLAN